METMGKIFTALLALVALAAAVTTIMNADDIKRYLEMKNM